ncbi:Dcp1p-Dcp2p decapping enzyme complex alpha subunit [Puccinia graminis f. sp. tritici]|uniref:Dcp1p-Dcp2p decapping enzyme complex alpha subunit n=1 Tax=Puccinia graminis f. sp. tritici TaxID=56615 RepID=A0A5B0S9R7_PUCGR|nr:Dcp1p-Dcp2p decapping enzyme complex alpha subunit [Puccinia graminis f. sp. tritici]
MKFGLGVPNIQKESDSDNSERSNTDIPTDAFESPEGSPTRFNPNTADMANNNPPNLPNDQNPILSLQNQLSEMKAGFEAIVQQQNQTIANLANLATSCLQPQEAQPSSYKDLMLRQFIKDPVQTHNRTNPQQPILAFDGSNYIEWEKAIDRTLQHAFVRESPFINFEALGVVENKKVAELMRNTLHTSLLTIVESEGLSSSKEMFKAIREKCKKSGRRHKVILVNRIIKFATERSPASKSWLARFCTIMTDIERAKITINEFAGLILQSLTTAPPGVDSKNFEYSVNQPLDNMSSVPSLGEVTTIIQSALSKIGNSGQLPPGTIPSDVEMSVQAMKTQPRGFYKPPQIRTKEEQQLNNSNSSKFSVEKASFYKGKGHSDSLLAKFGYACLYCRETGHWYAD